MGDKINIVKRRLKTTNIARKKVGLPPLPKKPKRYKDYILEEKARKKR